MKNIVVMFPYPSGDGLHVGHAYNYAVMDSYCRWLRYMGEEVFQPFGYDAFGLPAENYARQIGGDARTITEANVERFRAQMARMNTEYDDLLVTCDPSFYRWSQWLFEEMRKHDMAYQAEAEVNWCPSCDTVLANEQAQDGRCERCSSLVEKRVMRQWFFRITAYKERLLKNLDTLDYPSSTIEQQRHWLNKLRDWCVSRQRKWGTPIPNDSDTLDTFVDSSFYFLRYLTDSDDEFLPKGAYRSVDLYVGGPEHACMHLIYARFVHMFLFDRGIVPQEEPFNKVIHQGMITRNGRKMSKRYGNAVNPDDYDPDVLRMHLMFIGPYEEGGDWRDDNIQGVVRFLARMRKWLSDPGEEAMDVHALQRQVHQHVLRFKFNRVVSTFMEFYNQNRNKKPTPHAVEAITKMLGCFAPSFAGVLANE
jgi:leucyl-tRNA synthetase